MLNLCCGPVVCEPTMLLLRQAVAMASKSCELLQVALCLASSSMQATTPKGQRINAQTHSPWRLISQVR